MRCLLCSRSATGLWPVTLGRRLCHQARLGSTRMSRAHKCAVFQARALLVINHVSYLDALVMGQIFMPCGLAKSAVKNIPCVGLLACALQVASPAERNTFSNSGSVACAPQ